MNDKGSNRVAMERDRTKYLGVYQRQSDTRTYNGKPDVCFDVTFKRDGKKIWGVAPHIRLTEGATFLARCFV